MALAARTTQGTGVESQITERLLGPAHPQTLACRSGVAAALTAQRKYAQAEVEYRAVLQIQERVLEPEDPLTLSTRDNVADELSNQSRDKEAEYRALVKVRERLIGPEHRLTLVSIAKLVRNLRIQGNLAEAREFARRAAEGARKTLPPDDAVRKNAEKVDDFIRIKE